MALDPASVGGGIEVSRGDECAGGGVMYGGAGCGATGPGGWGRTGCRTRVRSSSAWLPLVTPRACLFPATLGERTFRTATKL